MRDASIAVLRGIGVETGGSNVQFAIHPENGRMVVIEMNPRVSRSSALASKATGFPIAHIAALLAVGYTLDELGNQITNNKTPASFEPSIDYVVTKIPRFAFEKFRGADPILTTSMKSVGEVMAIGRNFEESIQKALRSLEKGLLGFDEILSKSNLHPDELRAKLSRPTPQRILFVAEAMRSGFTIEEIYALCKYDRWFLERIHSIVMQEKEIQENGLPRNAEGWIALKKMGFSDSRLGAILNVSEQKIKLAREKYNVRKTYKRVDTCAAEIPSSTAYMYSTYEGDGIYPAENECQPTNNDKIIILGGGPNRIGQGIEFDYCCVHAAYALKESGIETIMINCNPETVSTDFDTSDRLYFEPLTHEEVLEIINNEKDNGNVLGVIVQLGGQTPLKLASSLQDAGVNILGTNPDAIDLAEDRERFQKLLKELKLRQPYNGLARSEKEALELAEEIGFPMVVRPSYVLGGQAMEIVHNIDDLKQYISTAVHLSGKTPVLLDRYLRGAIEVDVDALCDSNDVYIAGIMEHIEEAGIHSGDSACVLPPHSLPYKTVRELQRQTVKLAKALNVIGLINIQFAVKKNRTSGNWDIYILEVNPRASRTVPFVAKATGVPVAKIAARLMAGEKLDSFKELLTGMDPEHTSVKAPVFPFNRFPGVDPLLGPEMKSTGEVMGIDLDIAQAYVKAQLAAGTVLPKEGNVFLSVKNADKNASIDIAKDLIELGFTIYATGGTCEFLQDKGLKVHRINKVMEGQPHIVDAIINEEIDLMINTTTKGQQAFADSDNIRRMALMHKIPHYTLLSAARAGIQSIRSIKAKDINVCALQNYFIHEEELHQENAAE
jgi:carbamoyl-phosphate synthase large subunit